MADAEDALQIEALLLRRYVRSSMLHAAKQFAWAPAPLVMFWTPVRLTGRGHFELMPDGLKPRKRDWHWVLAARTGIPHPDHSLTGRRESHKLESRLGGTILDFVACTPDLMQVRGLLFDMIDVLGNPREPALAADPVRVHATPLAWLAGGCDGIVPVGREHGVHAWLRNCAAGLITDSVAHGEALLVKMRREVPRLPKILVAE